ncbi:MAG TPA: hypothetical protein VED63_02015, partial [Acidimicrobiales bacterium]|nr:hypothetical protein [Acidimicrobiales bacterium]
WWTGSTWSAQVTAATPAGARPSTGKPGIVVAVVLLVVGAGLVAPGIAFMARGFIDQVALSPSMSVPGTRTFVLAPGDYELYEAEGSVPVPALSVSVTGPDGASVPVYVPSGVATITRGTVDYGAVVGFQAVGAGAYTLAVQTENSEPDRVIVAESLTSLLRSMAAWAAAVGVGVLMGIAGVVLLVVSIVAYHRARAVPAGPGRRVGT